MGFGTILLLAVALAMDAMAVATAKGVRLKRIRARQVAAVALVFGGFQAAMPSIGLVLGQRFTPWIKDWDHWVAFGLLAAIGGKMLYETFWGHDVEDSSAAQSDAFGFRLLIMLGIATSIDALAAGISLPLMDAPFALSITTIGVVTALLSASGLWLGRQFGRALGGHLDAVGGVLLIGIGTKILIQHLAA